ncbi:MAG: hypothetical protein JXO51_08610 [Candidatus Aminicenantes bacterium]|nr:hypothetical protein [Candidatus Aminicenantes bacterium]
MDNKSETSLDIGSNDMEFIRKFLKGKTQPLELDEVVYQLALFKTREDRKSRVKVYDSGCEYQAGDLIYKEYPGQLPVGNKKYISVDEGVILKIEEVRSRLGRDEVRLSYEGTSEFRRYAEYLVKQKIELLLPHKEESPPRSATYISAAIDPRRTQSPLVERDFNLLRKKLSAALNRDADIAFINGKVMLKESLKPIAPEVFDSIRQFLKGRQASESTEFFVENFCKVKPAAADFAATCFALNTILTSQYKIDLQQTSSVGWGKWHLISALYHIKKNSLVSESNSFLNKVSFADRKNLPQKRKKFEEQIFSEGETRYYLTQREIASGALRLKPGLYRFGDAVEIEAVDTVTHKRHTLYFYENENLILGLDKAYESYKALQGTTLVFEQSGAGEFQFTIKTTKRGAITDRIDYDAEHKIFIASGEKMASTVAPNKSIFLETEVFHSLAERMEEFRKTETFNKLFHKVFLEFGNREKNYEIHILRLYHILDLIAPVDLKLVEEVILSNPEFIPSEKMAGVFYLDSDAVVEIEEEEKLRRQGVIEDMKRKREESRRQQQDEELKAKEEIRLLREERRRKREEEMWQKEKLHHERDTLRRGEAAAPREAVPGASRGRRVKEAPAGAEAPFSDIPAKPEAVKKPKKKIEAEKPAKTVKKGQKKILEEKIEMEEIKKQILHEDLIETADGKEEEVKKEPVKEVKVAYQDEGAFGGLFASQLDQIVKKETGEPEEKKVKKPDKGKKKSGKQ